MRIPTIPLSVLTMALLSVSAAEIQPNVLGTAVLLAPEVNPPHLVRGSIPERGLRAARPAADPVEWIIGELSDEEQKLVELINRARANPRAEVTRLQTLPDADVQGAYTGFGVDFELFAADMATRPVVPPLTPQAQLTAAARGHSQYQFDNAVQSHFQTDFSTGMVLNGISGRVTAVGYPWSSLRESVFSYSYNMEHAHAGFEVDWGNGPGGQQSPPGHRESNHDGAMTELGVGVVVGNNTVIRPDSTNSVGPRVVTLDFGRPQTLRNYVTGVAYFDLNGDGEYDEGEGLPGVRVDVSGAAHFARTTVAGGYGVPVLAGARTVTFTAPGLAPVNRSVTMNGASAKVDLAMPYTAPLLNGPGAPTVGTVNLYQPAAFPSVTHYEWRALRRPLFTAVLGAEGGVDGFLASTTGSYTPRTTASHSAGLASYRLVNATPAPQYLTQTNELVSGIGAAVRFKWRLGFSTTNSTAAVEISIDGGATWGAIWSREGLGEDVLPGAAFTAENLPLNLPVDTTFRLRFRFSVPSGGSFFNSETDQRVGFFFDEVTYSGVSEALPAGGGEVAAGASVHFTPAAVGTYLLQARPKIGPRVYPFREGLTVTAQPGGTVTAVTRITAATLGPNGKLRVDFSVLSGMAQGFDLEHASSLGGVWTRDAGAVLSTNAPGQLTFRTTPVGNTGFLRVRAK